MASPLIIVESREKAKTLTSQFGNDAEFLVVSSSPMKISFADEEGDATSGKTIFDFSPLPQEKELIEALQAGREREIFIALPEDQEGVYWSWMIDGYFSKLTDGANTIRSLQILGLRRDEVVSAYGEATSVDSAAGEACYARLLFHTALAGHISMLLGTPVGPGNLPLSYNSLTTIFLLVDREEQIRTYSPAMKWQVQVDLQGPNGNFTVNLVKAPGSTEDGFFMDASQGKEAVKLFKDLLFEVSSVERESVDIQPPAPFRLSDLLGDAAIRFNMEPKDVLMAVQRLYSGVEVNGVSTGLISSFYPQAEGNFEGLNEKLREQAELDFGAEAVVDEVEPLDGYRGLILPLDPKITEKDLPDSLPDECRRIYGIIRSRALASRMVEALEEAIDVELKAGPDCLFRVNGRVVTEKGFLAAYQESADQALLDPCTLTELEVGNTLSLDKIVPVQTRGYPPEYYTYDSLFDELIDFTVELDPAAVHMIQNMLAGGYLSVSPLGELRIGENAFKVATALFRAFPSMRGVNLSAYLEQTTMEAVSGRKGLGFAMRQFHQTLTMQGKTLVKSEDISTKLRSRKKTSSRIIATPQEQEKPLAKAPEKRESVAEKTVEAVSPEIPAKVAVPQPEIPREVVQPPEEPSEEAETVVPVEEEIPAVETSIPAETEVTETPPTTEELAATEDLFEESQAMAQAESLAAEKAAAISADTVSVGEGESSGMLCPVCKKTDIINKRTRTGREFYVCPEKSCEFLAWAKPHAIPCQVCHSPFLVEKKNMRGQNLLRCPRAGCNYMEPLDGGELDATSPVKGKKRLVRRVARKGGAKSGGKRRVVVRRR